MNGHDHLILRRTTILEHRCGIFLNRRAIEAQRRDIFTQRAGVDQFHAVKTQLITYRAA